jgi:outer membrane immunogenic protein
MIASLAVGSACAHAQALPTASSLAMDIWGSYTAIHANAPPAQCGCFYMTGFSASVAVRARHGIGFVFDYGRTNNPNVNGANHNLTLATYMQGVRYSMFQSHRLVPFGEALIGFGHTQSNYAIDRNATGFAYAGGGGVDLKVSSRFDVRPVEFLYLKTDIPNGVNNRQNQYRMSAGLIYHLTPR